MSQEPEPVVSDRHPLGLPAGSIRAILVIGIVGGFLLCISGPQFIQVPLYLYFLLFGVFLFFASHGRTIAAGGHSPLFLPAGTLRFLIIGSIIGIVAWQYWKDPQELVKRLQPKDVEQIAWADFIAATAGGFFMGWLISRGPWRNAPAFQDLLAWVALIAFLLMLIEALWKGFIDPNGVRIEHRVVWESILLAVVSFYFGSRS